MTGMGPTALSNTFEKFVESEQSSGIVLLACTVLALGMANSAVGPEYLAFWRRTLGPLSLAEWINDALMAVFFLLIGLELEREIYVGELSDPRNALLPIVAALGGMMAPALIHWSLNAGTPTQAGIGIPMATDIAFAVGILALLGNRVPASLKLFVVAFAAIDDLGAIVVIALFYTADLHVGSLAGGLAVWALLIGLNRLRVMSLWPYLLGGTLMWGLVLASGVHATVAGVMLAFAIPFSAREGGGVSPSHRLEHLLQRPVAFAILPIFALANAGVVVGTDWMGQLASANSLGIAAGLVAGKPLGVTLACLAAVASGACRLPADLSWLHVAGAGVLGGTGFTMSIFIANLAYPGDPGMANASKMAILAASLAAGVFGFLWLSATGRSAAR